MYRPLTHSVQAMEGLDRLLANPRTHVHEDKHRKAWYVSTLPGCYTCDDHEAEELERGVFESHIGIWSREDQKGESEAFVAQEGEGGNQVKPEKVPVQKHGLKRYTAKDLQSKDFKMPPPPAGMLQWRCKRCRKRAEGVPYSGPPHDGKFGCILGPREPPSLPEVNPTGERRATRLYENVEISRNSSLNL